VTTRNQAFLDKVQSTESSLANSITDPAERKRVALGQVADSYAAEYPDYQLVQVLAAVQPQHTLTVVNKLSVTRSTEPTRSLGDDLVKDGPAVFEADEARTLYVDLKSRLESRKVADYVKGSDSQLTVKEVLASTPDEAEKLLGAEALCRVPQELPGRPGRRHHRGRSPRQGRTKRTGGEGGGRHPGRQAR
jgi:hypothetical protein